MRTSDGVAFAILGKRPIAPAATVVVLAIDATFSLDPSANLECTEILNDVRYLCVSIDLPAHGNERRNGEPEGLAGWRFRMDSADDPIAESNERLRRVLDYLIQRQFADADRVAACGVSRGGFAALHFAAVDPRVRCVAAFAPVTDLKALVEFRGAEANPLLRRLSLDSHAAEFADRGIWISIGDRDERVNTDSAIHLGRAISSAAVKKGVPSQVELHVCPAIGHRTPEGAGAQAAAWMARAISGK